MLPSFTVLVVKAVVLFSVLEDMGVVDTGLIFRSLRRDAVPFVFGVPVVLLILIRLVEGSVLPGVVTVVVSLLVGVVIFVFSEATEDIVVSRIFADFGTLNQFGKKLLFQYCESALTAHNKPIKKYTRIFVRLVSRKDLRYDSTFVLEY